MRVNTGGDRQLNRLLHTIAMTQVRTEDHVGRRYYERKRAEGKTHLAALRRLKRVLAGIVYYRLRTADQVVCSLDAESGPNVKIAMAA